MNILSLYFKRWVVEDLGREGLYYDIAFSVSMLLTGLIMPALGAISDHSQKKKMFLFLFTISCCISIGLIPALSPGMFSIIMVLFAFSNFFYEGGMVFYNSLLYSVSDGREARFASGVGVALGYVGSITGMVLVLPFVAGEFFGIDIPFLSAAGKSSAFLPTAILFFAFSIPLFLWVRERRDLSMNGEINIRKAYLEVWEGIRNSKKYRGVLRFLIADYFIEDAVATVIINMGVFSSVVYGFNDSDLTIFFMIATIAAAAGAYIIGFFARNLPLKILMQSIVLTMTFAILGFIAAEGKAIVYLLGSIIGITLGGLWTVSRPLLAELAPKNELGRFFGLYSLSGRAAAVVGPLIYGLIIYLFNPGRMLGKAIIDWLGVSEIDSPKIPYRLAVISLALMMVAGLIIFRKVPSGKERR
jgi:UMF1 family MFS transporter